MVGRSRSDHVQQLTPLLRTDKRKNVTNKGYGIPGKFVFAMREVSKHLDDGRPILEDLNLQFYLGQVPGLLASISIFTSIPAQY
jgi:ATPase subunit of ABC transporter with duplicated ATPase domains